MQFNLKVLKSKLQKSVESTSITFNIQNTTTKKPRDDDQQLHRLRVVKFVHALK